MYDVTLYLNTGFNAENIPDSPALLETCQKVTSIQAIDTLQERILPSIRIRASWIIVKDADYCKVGDWYYQIDDMKMLSTDCAILFLTPDYLLSAGGVMGLVFLDGVTERVCVPTSQDKYGAYTEADPLTAPANALELMQQYIKPKNGANVQQLYQVDADEDVFITLIESSIDLENTATEAKTFTDDVASTTVTVPICNIVEGQTEHQYGGTHGTITYPITWPVPDGTDTGWMYGTDPVRKSGINRARSLGYESAIIAQYQIPLSMYSESVSKAYEPNEVNVGVLNDRGGFSKLYGIQAEMDADQLPWEQSIDGYTVKNKRALYGEYVQYGMLTMGGNRVEFDASTIYGGIQGDYPKIICRPDIRAEGCPYYRFLVNNGSTFADGFWENSVAGANWEQVPLVYTGKSGGELDRLEYQATRNYNAFSYNQEYGALGTAKRAVARAESTAKAAGQASSLAGAAVTTSAGLVGGVATELIEREQGKQQYAATSAKDAISFALGQVKAPEISFPYNSSIMRDALGNGVIVYRYYYTPYDLQRIDRLLTMYGYKHTKALDRTDFTNRPKFNYVQAHGVEVTAGSLGTLPRWWNNGIGAQLDNGVRVWHVLPDVNIYSAGNIPDENGG